jgi:hypothetical protein
VKSPVAGFSWPTMTGPANPPQLPIELIASPPATRVPVRIEVEQGPERADGCIDAQRDEPERQHYEGKRPGLTRQRLHPTGIEAAPHALALHFGQVEGRWRRSSGVT